jgi:hypothetical protein
VPARVVESRGRWVAATLAAGGIVLGLLMLFRLPSPPTPLATSVVSAAPRATMKMARPEEGNALLKEEAELRDMRPLFLPTERNAALPEPRLEPGRTFLDNETLKLVFSEAEAHVSRELPPVATLNSKPVDQATAVDLLSPVETGLTFQGFGRRERRVTTFTERGGYVEVTDLKQGGSVLSGTLSLEARPSGEKSWAPVEFVAAIDAAGLVSPLIVAVGSRVEEVDAHFKKYLTQKYRIGERLPPGFYRITVAP